MPVLEKHVEARYRDGIKALGGTAYKFTSPQRRSVPDRLSVLPFGLVAFAEIKAPGNVPTEAQWREIHRLREKGHRVVVLDSYEAVDEELRYLCSMLELAETRTVSLELE